MYYLIPTATPLPLDLLTNFSNFAALALDSGEKALNRCISAQRDVLSTLRDQRHENGLPLPAPAAEALKQHAQLLAQEWFEGVMTVHEQAIRSLESNAHGMNQYLAYAIDKAGKATPPEAINALGILKNALASLDATVTSVAESAVQTAEHLEEELVASTADATPKAAPSRSRRKAA